MCFYLPKANVLIWPGNNGMVLLSLLLALLSGGCNIRTPDTNSSNRIIVFAAASLIDVLEPLADSFEARHPDIKIVVHTAGSSLLARQLAQGAQADVFLSANSDWMTYLVDLGKMRTESENVISNKLVAVAKKEDGKSEDLLNLLVNASRIALADPEHVPAGMYAREALECLGQWHAVQDKIVPTLDVRAALQALKYGAVSVSIVYKSDIPVAFEGYYIDEMASSCQPEIRYAFGVHTTASNPSGAAAWIAHLTAPEQAAVWEGFGFIYRPASRP